MRNLHFEARYNKITDVSALATALSALSTALTNLNISLGGYTATKNTLTSESVQLLVRSIRHFSNLVDLSLDLGYTGNINSLKTNNYIFNFN